MEVGREKLGLSRGGEIDILNVKCDPMLIGSYCTQEEFFSAYYMNKENCISILLGKPELDEAIKRLLALSLKNRNNRGEYMAMCYKLAWR